MSYGYTCDSQESPECEGDYPDQRPMLMGQLHEYQFKSTKVGGHLKNEGYSPHQTITICPVCALSLLRK